MTCWRRPLSDCSTEISQLRVSDWLSRILPISA
jgi:hypothetical protein